MTAPTQPDRWHDLVCRAMEAATSLTCQRSAVEYKQVQGVLPTLRWTLTRSLDYGKEGLMPHSTEKDLDDRFGVPRAAILERLWQSTSVNSETGCWEWTGTIVHGYGQISIRRQRWRTHRLSYTLLVGDIPVGMSIDHVYVKGCRSKKCWNPDHLEPVTAQENTARYWRIPENQTPGLCRQGHPASGGPCRVCARQRVECARCGKVVRHSNMSYHRKTPGCQSATTPVDLAETTSHD